MSDTFDEARRKALYTQLAANFPEDAIQRTKGSQTGRGYDTTGIGYQYVVNRLNDVLGVGGWRVTDRLVAVKPGAPTSKGRATFDAVVEMKLQLGQWSADKFLVFAEAIGDGCHNSVSEGDAIKGAYTNAFKKAAAFLGVGKQAYEGTLDDDNVPAADGGHANGGGGFTPPASAPPAIPPITTDPVGHYKARLLAARSQTEYVEIFDGGLRKTNPTIESEVWGATEAHYVSLPKEAPQETSRSNGGGGGSSDADIDGKYGDPEVFSDPKRGWDGASFKGKKFSQCPPDYLDALAGFLDWQAGKKREEGDEKNAGYKDKDAARARAWAARKRSQGQKAAA